jgi:hypothetical protein
MTPDPQDPTTKVLLSAVTANTTGEVLDAPRSEVATFYTTASGVSSGATRVLEARDPATGAWHTIDSLASTDGDFTDPVVWVGCASGFRASISGYSDGTYTVTATFR